MTAVLKSLYVSADIGVPLDPSVKYPDLRERAMAAVKTADLLEDYGYQPPEADDEDKRIAELLADIYAEDPEAASKQVTNARLCELAEERPASLILVGSILDEFGQMVVSNSVRIRHLVTNKLLLESENPDARIRLRALEMLGKISDVGLFTEKKEVTVNHTSSQELRASLKEKLRARLGDTDDIEDLPEAEYEIVQRDD